jgi:hypothetical protein
VDPRRVWHIAIDTFARTPDDIADPGHEAPLPRPLCTVRGRSIVVLVGPNA